MIYVWVFLLLTLNTCWLAGILFALPGNWLMIITTAWFAWWRWDDGIFSIGVLIAVAVLAWIGELIEFFAGAGSARRAGAGWWGALAAIGGMICGALLGTVLIPIPIAGTLLGACLGAGLATWGVERLSGKAHDKSVKSGVGAGVGVFVGTTTKFLIGCVIWLIIAVAAFWP
ncbi:MAG: DUF456 domain-containing protein [Planctomycetes bacterium]|nr:DUF456 domain-containing protein [Planctomycetota bacterium]